MPNAHLPKAAHKVFLCLHRKAFLEVFLYQCRPRKFKTGAICSHVSKRPGQN